MRRFASLKWESSRLIKIKGRAGGYLVVAPDWKPITWTEEERSRGQA
ncbi:Catechol 2,3-dioxygenase [Geobacillus sp. B4113_201601]|nr:Catechol 2,3-dioxygenase [Geobacillus sp. B4113_201601]